MTGRRAELDNLLRKYKYREALDLAVAGEDPSVAVALFADYVDRNCLDAALLGRNDVGVAAILTFVSDYISVPHFDAVLCDVFTRVLKLYSATMHQSGTFCVVVVAQRSLILTRARGKSCCWSWLRKRGTSWIARLRCRCVTCSSKANWKRCEPK